MHGQQNVKICLLYTTNYKQEYIS